MHKIMKLLLSILLVFTLTSCSSKKGSDTFEEWCDSLVSELLGNSDYTLYSIFEDPSSVGIDMEVDGLIFTTKEDHEAFVKDCKDILKELRTYEYDDLNKDQKITYDVLEDNLLNMINLKDHYYLSTNYFDINNGVQSALAINLYFMDIVSKEALDAMLSVMKSTKEMFPRYVAFEQERQDAGYGLSETYMDEVLEQVNTFNSMDHSYLLEGFNEKIDNASFLDANEKTSYKEEVKKIYNDYFIPAYKTLEKDLKSIVIKTKDEDASLADYKDGKEYYRKIVYETTGFHTVEEFELYLNAMENKLTSRLYDLVDKYPSLYDKIMEENIENPVYTKYDNVKDTLSYLEKMVNENKDFPSVEGIDYEMSVIPEQLQEIYKASAAYFIGPFDNPNAKEQMILNGEFDQSDYNTLAHEGFPGHMYQYRYFKTTDHHVLRDILANGGYSEGWAVYASKEMNAYAQDAPLCEYMSINEDFIYLYIMKMDLMIHYENCDREEVYDYLRTYFNGLNEEDLAATYEQVLLDPGIFFPYYGYYFRLLDLKETAKEEWSLSYSDYKFHKEVLDLGALSYNVLENYLEEQW